MDNLIKPRSLEAPRLDQCSRSKSNFISTRSLLLLVWATESTQTIFTHSIIPQSLPVTFTCPTRSDSSSVELFLTTQEESSFLTDRQETKTELRADVAQANEGGGHQFSEISASSLCRASQSDPFVDPRCSLLERCVDFVSKARWKKRKIDFRRRN